MKKFHLYWEEKEIPIQQSYMINIIMLNSIKYMRIQYY